MAVVKRSTKLDAESLDQLEATIEDLRVAFERYFVGIDRCAPQRERDMVDREIKLMAGRSGSSTALRFRLDALRGRFVTYDQHWRRVLRDIENGTFKRIIAESERRRRLEMAEQQRVRTLALSAAARQDEVQPDEGQANDAQTASTPAQSPSSPSSSPPSAAANTKPPPAATPKPGTQGAAPPPPALGPRLPDGMDAAQARALFKAFVAAKKANGESTDGLSYAGLVSKLASEVPRLREQHGTGIDFDVSSEGGKVKLVARLRK